MNHKKFLPLVALMALFPLTAVIAITQFGGTAFEEMISGISVLTVYALMMIGSLLRFGIIFLGVFAIYKVLWERVNGGRMENSKA